MHDDTHPSTWATYQAAWADTTPDQRAELLDASLADDCIYADPFGVWAGRTAIARLIEQFRVDRPGVFFRNHVLLHHHGWSLARWTLYHADGAEAQPGASAAEYGADGRIIRVTGFFPFPAAPT